MMEGGGGESSRSLRRAFAVIVILLVALSVIAVVVADRSVPDAALSLGLPFAVAAVYLVAGISAWERRPTNPVGALIVAGSAAVVVGCLVNSGEPALRLVGTVASSAIIAVCVHLLLIYPGGRLVGWVERVTAGFAYLTVVGMQAVIVVVVETTAVAATTDRTVGVLLAVKGWAMFAVQLTVVVVLALRLARAGSAARRLLTSFYLYGLVAVVAVPMLPILGLDPVALFVTQYVLLCSVPVAFVLGMLRGRFVPESTDTHRRAGDQRVGDPELSQALTRLLGDPTAEVLLWSEARGLRDLRGDAIDSVVVDPAEGHGLRMRSSDERFGVHAIRDGPNLLAAIVYSTLLVTDSSRLEAAGQLIAVAVARQRLTDRLRRSEQEVRDSRVRLVGAADDARAQIAQNLHDGVQMRLVVLSMQAGSLAARLDDADAATAATSLREAIDVAAAEVRGLVREVMPPLLVERGLGAAIEGLAGHAPVPSTVEISPSVAQAERRIPPSIQRALYFVAAEALTNVVKHARASSVAVHLTLDDGELGMDICDDGVGAEWNSTGTARGGQPTGIGVRGIVDRVETMGGRVAFGSEPGGGTRVSVRMPCGW